MIIHFLNSAFCIWSLINYFNSQVKGEVVATGGKPGEVIVHVAQDKNATMIICGTRGHGAIRRTIMGSISTYIVHHSAVPVVVCRQKGQQNPDHGHKNQHHWTLYNSSKCKPFCTLIIRRIKGYNILWFITICRIPSFIYVFWLPLWYLIFLWTKS